MSDSGSKIAPAAHLRVAIIHYWFVGRAGGERVVESLVELFPQADLFALIADPNQLSPILKNRPLKTSFLQRIPGAIKFHRHTLFLQPMALEQFDLSNYDLVISSESGPAKGVITSSRTCHICYCHSPMRYIWDMYPQYRRGMSFLVGSIFSLTAHYMRLWDFASAQRVDYFVANSNFIASRIRKYYGRSSVVIHPPVEAAAGTIDAAPDDYYLAVGRLVDYKRFDLAVQACTQLGKKLKVIGDGPEYKNLRRTAGPGIEFLGAVDDDELRSHFARCRALLFPGEEDFGIVPVEAQSYGRPVVAYASGGALETIRGTLPGQAAAADPTGVFFAEQSVSSLSAAILEFESREKEFRPESIRQNSLQFDRQRFKEQMATFVSAALQDFNDRNRKDKAFVESANLLFKR